MSNSVTRFILWRDVPGAHPQPLGEVTRGTCFPTLSLLASAGLATQTRPLPKAGGSAGPRTNRAGGFPNAPPPAPAQETQPLGGG